MSEEKGLFWLIVLFLVLVFVGSDEFGRLAGKVIEMGIEFLKGLK